MLDLMTIRQQAEMLAKDNRDTEPGITEIFWFPHEEEVRLVEVDSTVPISVDGKVHPYRFRPSPPDNMPAPSDIALIRPEEVGQLELPEDWCSWDEAEKL